MRNLTIERHPIAGSPKTALYVIDPDDPDFERGPFDFIEQAQDGLTEALAEEES